MLSTGYSAADLVRGAYYAFEQAGILLRDSRVLYAKKRYSSAVVLAIFASEELGRARIYLERRRALSPTGFIGKRDLERACSDHLLKLAKGQVLVGFDAPRDPKEMTDDELFKIADRVKKRVPGERFKQRIRSLYVDPSDSSQGWNRPCETSALECMYLINTITNDYAMFPEYYLWPDRVVQSVLENWKDRPSPLSPRRVGKRG